MRLMVGSSAEIARRARSRVTHRLESLPILALSVHSACNCRCVMCDIWKANADKREISAGRSRAACRRDPRAARAARDADRRRAAAASQSLGALPPAAGAAHPHHAGHDRPADRARMPPTSRARVDTVVISLDGDRDTHDAIRRVKGGFDRIARGVMALHAEHPTPRLIARSVVQRDNFASLPSDDRRRASHGLRRDLVSRRRCVVAGVQSAGAVD